MTNEWQQPVMDIPWEVVESRGLTGEWRVEAVGPDGECYLTRFYGPAAKQRAEDYATWIRGQA